MRAGTFLRTSRSLEMKTRIIVTALFGLWFATGATLVWSHGKKAWPAPMEAKALKNPVAAGESARAAGKVIYERNCASCHGIRGDGRGSMATKLAEKPADFTDAHMMHEMTDGEIFWKITEGRDPMPGFKKTLSDEQRWRLVYYLRSLAGSSSASGHSHSQHR